MSERRPFLRIRVHRDIAHIRRRSARRTPRSPDQSTHRVHAFRGAAAASESNPGAASSCRPSVQTQKLPGAGGNMVVEPRAIVHRGKPLKIFETATHPSSVFDAPAANEAVTL